ncbi:MAG: DUF4157 domain-containing protein [Kofleriaceae bacterium]
MPPGGATESFHNSVNDAQLHLKALERAKHPTAVAIAAASLRAAMTWARRSVADAPADKRAEWQARVDALESQATILIGVPEPLPHLGPIQRSFGRHDVGAIESHRGSVTGGRAYASGNTVVFDGEPDLHTAAHEAAHVVQQRAGVASADARHEEHADAVADLVVQGESAEALLDQFVPDGASATVVQFASSSTATRAKMESKYGLRPRKYEPQLDGKRHVDKHDKVLAEREQRIRAALPKVVARLNAVCEAKHVPFRFTAAELATNFFSEGAVLLLTEYTNGTLEPDTNIDGFGFLGIDTFIDRKAELDSWMTPDLKARIADPTAQGQGHNEASELVNYLIPATLEQALEANAVMFASARERFAADLAKLGMTATSDEAWFFWTTIYYNTRESTALDLLTRHGVGYWKTKWTKGEDEKKFNRIPKYNAAWRTSTWDSMRTILGDDLDKPDLHHQKPLPPLQYH